MPSVWQGPSSDRGKARKPLVTWDKLFNSFTLNVSQTSDVLNTRESSVQLQTQERVSDVKTQT